MYFNKKIALFAGSLFLTTTVFASTDADQAISAAEAAQKSASKVGYEWRDTGKLISKAKELAKQGKSSEAIKLAKKAEEQGKDAVAQYHSEVNRISK